MTKSTKNYDIYTVIVVNNNGNCIPKIDQVWIVKINFLKDLQ